jgi:hypothetical protein
MPREERTMDFADLELQEFGFAHQSATKTQVWCRRCGWKHQLPKCKIRVLSAAVKAQLLVHQRTCPGADPYLPPAG